MKKLNKKQIFALVIALVVIIVLLYKNVFAPRMYTKYMNEGQQYLNTKMYEESIDCFDKAIKLKPRDIEARVYQAQAYIGNNQIKPAIQQLQDAQQLDVTNEDLLLRILDILNLVDGDKAYEFLETYVNAVGKDNLSDKIKDMLNSADETPQTPNLDKKAGQYLDEIVVKLDLKEIKLGHTYYYTTDESMPSKSATKYVDKIEISKTTTIKIIGYNKNGESTGVVIYKYIIDKDILSDLKSIIKEGESLIDSTSVGSKVGNISKENKNKLQTIIDEGNNLIKKDSLVYKDVKDMKTKVETGITDFKNNIIKPVDKNELKTQISNGENLYNSSTEGSSNGQYKQGSRATLLEAIKKGKTVYDNKSATQEEVNNQVSALTTAINNFNNSKVSNTNLEQQILGKYVIFDTSSGIGISKFTQNQIISGYMASEGENASILGRSESGNTITYTTQYGTMVITLLGNNQINYNGMTTCELLTAQQLIGRVYSIAPDLTNYDYLSYFGITNEDLNTFYATR